MKRALCLLLLLLPTVTSAQKLLHYQFKPGEHLQYHYKTMSTLDAMRKRGDRESETTLEADPDWRIESVDMDGAATIVVTIPNREEDHRERIRHINASHITPQSRITMNDRGYLLYGKILVDDAPRVETKQLMDKVPDLTLMSDKDLLRQQMGWIWYVLDTLPLDTLGTEAISRFDTTVHGQSEKDTITFGHKDRIRTAHEFSYHHNGTSHYSLKDTVAEGSHFWRLLVVTDAEQNYRAYTGTYHKVTTVLFRKKDNLLHKLHITEEHHTRTAVNTGEVWIDLKSVDGG
jgi:hypothetical protein